MTTQQEAVLTPTPTTPTTAAPGAVPALRAQVTGDLLDIVVDLDSGDGCRLRDLRDGTETH